MRAANHVVNGKVATSSAMESHNCHSGTPKGTRSIMAAGEVNGNMERNTLSPPDGESIMAGSSNMVTSSGIVSGKEKS